MIPKARTKYFQRALFLLLILVLLICHLVLGSLANQNDESDGNRTKVTFDDPNGNAETTTDEDTETTTDEDTETTTDEDTEPVTTTKAEDDEDDDEDDDDNDGISDDWESETERELSFESSNKEFKIESKLKTGETKDKIKIDFRTEDKPEIELEYKSESEDLENELEMELEFLTLLEFNDSNGNGYLDTGDTEYSIYDFSEAEFDDLQYLISTTPDGEVLYQIWTQTTDQVFLLRFYAVSGFAIINSSIITPTEIKIDIEIQNYPYIRAGDLALRLRLRAEIKTEIEKNDESPDEIEGLTSGEEALTFLSSSNYLGFFSWALNASVDGIENLVVSGPFETLNDENSYENDVEDLETGLKQKGEILVTYPHGNHIIHDPKIGIAASTAYKSAGPHFPPLPTSLPFLEVDERLGSITLTIIGTLVISAMLFLNRRHRRF
ncbi:MAG: hypothetical protein ACFFB3_02630 [Candidatus Hodarchaeota archaeon]